MVTVNFYLDNNVDKNGLSPIHLYIREKTKQVKVAVGIKVNKNDWDTDSQVVLLSNQDFKSLNRFLSVIKEDLQKHIETAPATQLTDIKLKQKVKSLVKARKNNTEIKLMTEDNAFYNGRSPITFIDLFAGAGGFSEGFLQAFTDKFYFDFLLGSDINENCELTHLARYNYQLGLNAEFICQDITEKDFLPKLVDKLNAKLVDVVCGGPPCQSFSLAGKRRKFDKKDDLFSHYLKVIRLLRPKYFIMENVKGILTKEGGKIREMILQEIRSILDLQEYPKLIELIIQVRKNEKEKQFLIDCYLNRLRFELVEDEDLSELRNKYIKTIEERFKKITADNLDYKTSKTNESINTIRHGFSLLKRTNELDYIRKRVIFEKSFSNVDNDLFYTSFDSFLDAIDPDTIVEKIDTAFKQFFRKEDLSEEIKDIISALNILSYSFDECISGLSPFIKKNDQDETFNLILSKIRLYNIENHFVALASNYGVPQDRERVLFIGCRKDQRLITSIPPTVSNDDKVTVFEAIFDLDIIDNDEAIYDYKEINFASEKYMNYSKFQSLIKKRKVNGLLDQTEGKTFADWSRTGRLNGRFPNIKTPFYVRNRTELSNPSSHFIVPLQNHKTSNQNATVIQRLDIIRRDGNYDSAKADLVNQNLDSDKRNYNVLKLDSQSQTICTMPDDYIHYARPRALTVREMARLQSFDDSFVFQGKRSTGGEKRKSEVPQFSLVGNAVPPLLARAIAMTLLSNID